MRIRQEDDRTQLFVVAMLTAFLFGLVVGISASTYMKSDPPKPKEPPECKLALSDVSCFANPSSFLAADGWEPVHDADRARASLMAGKGKAVMRLEETLVCYDVRPGDSPYRVVVSEWWWKRT